MQTNYWYKTYSNFEYEIACDIWDEYQNDLIVGGIGSLEQMIQDRGLFKSLIQNFWSTRLND